MDRMQLHRPRMFTLVSAALVAGLLAGCIEESPLAFSPDGRTLAFVTVEPYRTQDGGFLTGAQTFRLMLLDDQRRIRVLETSTDAMLSAPAWSPDGQRLAYLRVPLQTREQADAQKKTLDEKLKSLQNLANPAWITWVAGSKEGLATQPASTQSAAAEPPPAESAASQPSIPQLQDQALPPLKGTFVSAAMMLLSPDTPATLVVREVQTGTMLSNTELELLASAPDYATTQPQFAPDGRQVYVPAGNLLLAIDLASGEKRVLASGAAPVQISPTGRTLAMTTDDALGLVATDGSLTLYRRLPASPAGGPAWIDARTVAVLESQLKPLALAEPETPPPATQSASERSGSAAIPRGSQSSDAGETITIVQPAAAKSGGIPDSATTRPAATTQPAPSANYVIQRIRTDGTLLEPVEILAPEGAPSQNLNQLAVAPDGRHLVISHGNGLSFASLDRRPARYVTEQNLRLEQPTFSPDSARVAAKVLAEAQNKSLRTTAIVFYSPEGKELYRVAIPPVAPAATQPAEQAHVQGR